MIFAEGNGVENEDFLSAMILSFADAVGGFEAELYWALRHAYELPRRAATSEVTTTNYKTSLARSPLVADPGMRDRYETLSEES